MVEHLEVNTVIQLRIHLHSSVLKSMPTHLSKIHFAVHRHCFSPQEETHICQQSRCSRGQYYYGL